MKKEFTDVCYRFCRSSENPFRQQCGMIKKSATGTPCPSYHQFSLALSFLYRVERTTILRTAAEFHPTGLLQERDHLTLSTRIKRLARKTICFSKSLEIHKAVIGTFINIYFFGRTFDKSLLL